MKKLLKPEMEFVKLNAQDVITASAGDTYTFNPAGNDNTTNNAHDSTDYSAGGNNLWNLNQ